MILLPSWRAGLARRAAAFIGAVALAISAHAQSVRWEAGESNFGAILQLVYEDCIPEGDPELPAISNATLREAGRTSSTNVVNMQVTRSVIYAYLVQRRSNGPIEIPEFTVKTNRGAMKVASFNSGAPASTDSLATSKLLPERNTVWAGEVFGLTYELTAARRNNPQVTPTFEWNPAPLVAEDWSPYEVDESVVGGQRIAKVTYRTRAYSKTANRVKLEAASHLLQVQTGSTTFGFLSQARMEPVSVASDQPVIEVRPLPTAPAGFGGAVGQFKLASKVVPGEASVGEPITWTLELTGTGNWPDIEGLPAREVSKDFHVVQPKAKRTPAEGKLFDATLAEDVVLVPTKAGTYALGPVVFTFFNPRTGAYETLRAERTSVTVKPAPAPQFGGTAPEPSPNQAAPSSPAVGAAPSKAAPAALPAGIPRDVLRGSAVAAVPLSRRTLAVWLTVPLLGVLAVWFVLACRRAMQTDPLRPQRDAQRAILSVLADMRKEANAGSAPTVGHLLRWQRHAAVLWGLDHAAPTATALETPRQSPGREERPAIIVQRKEWAALWREAERVIYSRQATLPADWIARAEEAAVAKRIATFNPVRLFLPKNLLPFAAVFAVLWSLPMPWLRAAVQAESSAQAQYEAGQFAAAEKAWRQTISKQPTDAIARHNLSLALAQQDRAGEAAAQAVAAFVQHPGEPAIRWQFAHAADKAGFAPEPLIPFLKEGPLPALAGLASPSRWQRVLIAAAFVLAGTLAWMLYNAYGRRARLQLWSALALSALASATAVTAAVGVNAYGAAASADAVVTYQPGVLRSIPTEADTTQKTSTLPPGSIGIVNHSFLGWNRLVFSNGQTGWVRKEQLVPLWR